MEFMALAGKPDVERSEKWTITMLMCLHLVKGDGLKTYERLQIMDCDINEEIWLKIGGVTTPLYLV